MKNTKCTCCKGSINKNSFDYVSCSKCRKPIHLNCIELTVLPPAIFRHKGKLDASNHYDTREYPVCQECLIDIQNEIKNIEKLLNLIDYLHYGIESSDWLDWVKEEKVKSKTIEVAREIIEKHLNQCVAEMEELKDFVKTQKELAACRSW